jgi:hypothetical protein
VKDNPQTETLLPIFTTEETGTLIRVTLESKRMYVHIQRKCINHDQHKDDFILRQVYDIENLLPLFDRFLSPDATQYVLCIYKVACTHSSSFTFSCGMYFLSQFCESGKEIMTEVCWVRCRASMLSRIWSMFFTFPTTGIFTALEIRTSPSLV